MSAERVSPRTWLAMFGRTFAVQGSWNYEILIGNGIGFCVEPALRALPGGRRGAPYHSAIARQSRYFNSHPYLAGIAVGALARAELDGVPEATIERFRTACCSPLGSVGDQLVWAAWLPFCSLLSLVAFGLGASAATVVAIFLATYNVGHVALRAWGLSVGLSRGLRVASALNSHVFREGPRYIARVAIVLAGVAVPLTIHRAVGGNLTLAFLTTLAAFGGALLVGLFAKSSQGWRVALGLVAVLVLYGVLR